MKRELTNASKLLWLVSFTLSASFAWSSDYSDPQKKIEQTDTIAKPRKDVEVIGVVGEHSDYFYLEKMQEAELDFYDAFNALVNDKKYKVLCKRQKRINSNISSKVCRPQYVINRMAQETKNALSSGAPIPSYKEIEFMLKKEREKSLLYAERVVTKNPQLLQKLILFNQAQRKYKEVKQSD